jgi:hypothetical protein
MTSQSLSSFVLQWRLCSHPVQQRAKHQMIEAECSHVAVNTSRRH